MIEVYRIPVSKDRLRAMLKDERALLLLLGYVANQLSMLQKLLIFSSNRTPPSELEQHLTGVQTQMLLRFTIGVLNEAWLLITKRFIQSAIAKDYQSRLDQGGQQALANLNQQFGTSNLLNKIRNNYAFHYPHNDAVEEAFEAAYNDSNLDAHWNLYFSHHGFNSLYFLSDFIFIHGIHKEIGKTDIDSAQHRLMSEVLSTTSNLIEFAKAFTAAAWLKHFGQEMLAKDTVVVKDAPNIDDVWLPFFVEVDTSSTPKPA